MERRWMRGKGERMQRRSGGEKIIWESERIFDGSEK